jgi:hypothetical protein
MTGSRKLSFSHGGKRRRMTGALPALTVTGFFETLVP